MRNKAGGPEGLVHPCPPASPCGSPGLDCAGPEGWERVAEAHGQKAVLPQKVAGYIRCLHLKERGLLSSKNPLFTWGLNDLPPK